MTRATDVRLRDRQVSLGALAESARAAVLKPVRRGGREVAWTPDFMGFGNLLFVAFWVDAGRRQGQDRWALSTPTLVPWLEVFPRLRGLVLDRSEVGFRDRRTRPWREDSKGEEFGGAHERGFSGEEMDRFVREYLLDDVVRRAGAPPRAGSVMVNVRRGDYYAVPEIRGQYAFDVDAYLRVALPAEVRAGGPVEEIRVVSDGIDWCRARLGWLTEVAPDVTFAEPADSAQQNFLDVAGSRRLVITNSTFSYWAAFVSTALHGDNHREVVAPRFFDRSQNGGRGWLMDERWTVVEDIPGGWDS